MHEELRPELQVFVDLIEGGGVVWSQLDALPPFVRLMRAFDGFHAEVEGACGGVGADRGVARVGERAGLAGAEAGDIVFISAERLVFGGSEE